MKKERNSTDRTTLKIYTQKIYRELGKSQVNVEKPHSQEEVETFWTSIWGTEKGYNEETEWLKWEEEWCEGLEEQKWDEIKVEDLKEALKKEQKWKSPRIDKVPNFWLNTFDSIHGNMINCFKRALTNHETNPQWLTQGITYPIPNASHVESFAHDHFMW